MTDLRIARIEAWTAENRAALTACVQLDDKATRYAIEDVIDADDDAPLSMYDRKDVDIVIALTLTMAS